MHGSVLGQDHQQVAEPAHNSCAKLYLEAFLGCTTADLNQMSCRGRLAMLRQAHQGMVKRWQTVLQKVQMRQIT